MTTPSLNLVVLIGEVMKPPDVRYTNNGKCKANIRLKTYRPIPDGRVFEDWHNVIWWGNAAEAAGQWPPGVILQVTGRIGSRSYMQDDVKKYVTEITAREVAVFGHETPQPRGNNDYRGGGSKPRPPAPPKAPQPYADDEDIPF